MQIGTKSLLFGVHQVFIHPIVVFLAWKHLYGWPNWKEMICIIIHDWGYWGKPNMNGKEGERHPIWAADKAYRFLDGGSSGYSLRYYRLCIYHSRHFARRAMTEPSKLCWADKLSIGYEPWWLYLPRARLSGELFEYRKASDKCEFVPISATHHEWFKKMRDGMVITGKTNNAEAIPYNR